MKYINETDKNFEFLDGDWKYSNTGTPMFTGGDAKSTETDGRIRFAFIGDTISIPAQPYSARSGNIEVIVNGESIGSYSMVGNPSSGIVTVFSQKLGPRQLYNIELINRDEARNFFFDGIYINVDGEMLPYRSETDIDNVLTIHKTLAKNIPDLGALRNEQLHITEEGDIYLTQINGTLIPIGVTRAEYNALNEKLEEVLKKLDSLGVV